MRQQGEDDASTKFCDALSQIRVLLRCGMSFLYKNWVWYSSAVVLCQYSGERNQLHSESTREEDPSTTQTAPQRMRLIIWLLMCKSILASEKKLIFIRGKIRHWFGMSSAARIHTMCALPLFGLLMQKAFRRIRYATTASRHFIARFLHAPGKLSPSARRRTAANRHHELTTERRSSSSGGLGHR